MKQNVLIFSPSFDGHRQVYLQYLTESLLKRDCLVYLVSDRTETTKKFPYLDDYHSNPSVKFETVQNALQISLSDFINLQNKLGIDLTIFAEADNHLELLNGQWQLGHSYLRGKNVGIFIRSTNYIHFSKPSAGTQFWNALRFIKHLPGSLYSDAVIFHEWALPKFSLLNASLVLDEFFSEKHPRTHRWLPDISFPLLPDDSEAAEVERQFWEPRLKDFQEKNKGREVLLYFGEAQRRRGYDTLLKLACENECCFIHCGLSSYAEEYTENITELKNKLRAQGLFFETNQYVQYYPTVRLFFEACQYVILPYRNHLGSSGLMLQAVHFGRPVLVPDQGLMADRVKLHQVGLTYNPQNDTDLKTQWNRIRENSANFSDHLTAYNQVFSKDNVLKTLGAVWNQVIG